jgi:hypothetical protein
MVHRKTQPRRDQKIFLSLLGVVFAVLLYHSFIETSALRGNLAPHEPKECEGDPITVTYPFEGGFLDPHACAPQCVDQKQRYIIYSNGFATQCEKPPGCRDLGEDRSVVCIIPN